jgi:hypothetical protein
VSNVDDRQSLSLAQQNIKRIERYAMDCSIAEGKAKERIAQLEREIETLKALRGRRASLDAKARHNWQDRVIGWGEKLGYPSLRFEMSVKEGVQAWRSFARAASDDALIRLIIATEHVDESQQS